MAASAFSKSLLALSFHPFSNKPSFLRVCIIGLLKTMWEKEKLLVTSNFSFSTMCSPGFENLLPFSSNLTLSPVIFLSLEESKICRLGKGSYISKHVNKQERHYSIAAAEKPLMHYKTDT